MGYFDGGWKPGKLWYQIFTGGKAKSRKEVRAEEQIEREKEKEDEIIRQRKEEHASAEQILQDLINNWPQLASNRELLDKLYTELTKGLTQLGEVVTDVEQKGSLYLSNLEKSLGLSRKELKRGETTAKTALDKSLGIYKNLAKRTEVPGAQAIRDQYGEDLAGGIKTIKRYGGGRGLSAITDLYKNKLNQSRLLGIEGANMQMQNKENLAGAEANYGLTMADIIRGNAATSTTMAQNFYSAQSDYLNKLATAKSNVADASMNVANTMYGAESQDKLNQYMYNELTPAQLQAQFQQSKYFATDPYQSQLDITGRDIGYGYSNLWTAEAERAANNKMFFDMITQGLQLYQTGGFKGFGNMFKSGQAGFTNTPNFSNYWEVPKGVNEFNKYTPFKFE